MGSKHSSGKAEIKEKKIIHQNCDLPDDKPEEVEEFIKNRMLLLGTGDSGKSTLRQKINALCNDDYGSGYLEDFCTIVQTDINDGMPVLIKLSGLPSDNEAVWQFNAAYRIAHQKVLTQGIYMIRKTILCGKCGHEKNKEKFAKSQLKKKKLAPRYCKACVEEERQEKQEKQEKEKQEKQEKQEQEAEGLGLGTSGTKMVTITTIVNDPKLAHDEKQARLKRILLAEKTKAAESTSEYFFACANSIKTLWADPAVQQAYHKSLEDPYNKVFNRIEAHYFLDRIEEISKPEYLPNEQDMLKVRNRTPGILTEVNTFNNSKFELIDVGGARSERRKWKHTYKENVAALIFVAALDCFDMTLYENDKDNRLVDSLICFDEVLGSQYPRGQYPCFEKSSMILLLTKRDLFEKKIRENKLSQSPTFKDKPVDYFDAFEGGTIDNYENGIEAIKAEFQQRFTARMGERELRIYVTCAAELDHLRSVWEDIWSGLTLSE